ncbi:MAG: response regulator transcription factor, partial [Microcystaceae cyanobacterium]
ENLIEILEIAQYDVLSAPDGVVGLQLAKTHLPDLILCDVMMPNMDGFEMLAALREDPNTSVIPLIFLTAKSEYSDRREGMELGADDYLTKPFEIDELFVAIHSRLARQGNYLNQIKEVTTTSKKSQKIAKENEENYQKYKEFLAIKDKFSAKVSSNLGRSINNINLAISILKRNNPSPHQEKFLDVLQDECNKQIQLLDEMVAMQHLLTPEAYHLLKRYEVLSSDN